MASSGEGAFPLSRRFVLVDHREETFAVMRESLARVAGVDFYSTGEADSPRRLVFEESARGPQNRESFQACPI